MNQPDQARALEILAPLAGLLVPLEQVPDPTFSGRLVGDGIAIDPLSGEVRSPVAGTVLQLNPSRHAVVLRTADAIDVMVHVGLETVSLGGDGFEACCRVGQQVAAGDVLLRFDVDRVACRARSLLTQVLVMNRSEVRVVAAGPGRIGPGEPLLHVLAEVGDPDVVPTLVEEAADAHEQGCILLAVPNHAGLHARPSAVLAAAARAVACEARLHRVGQPGPGANMKSASAIMQLGLAHGDAVQVRTSGAGAGHAAQTLAALLREGCGEQLAELSGVLMPLAVSTDVVVNDNCLRGQPASPGKALGNIVHWRSSLPPLVEAGAGVAQERAQLSAALTAAASQLEQEGGDQPVAAAIFEAHRELLADPDLLAAADDLMASGKSAAHAWHRACEQAAAVMRQLDNPLLSARAHDLQDIGARVVRQLLGGSDDGPVLPPLAAHSVLVTDNLTPSQVAALDVAQLAGVCLQEGGATGHAAILARARGLPMICGIDSAAAQLDAGREVLLDATAGLLWTAPSEQQKHALEQELAHARVTQRQAMAQAARPALTLDGRRVEIGANVASVAEVEQALAWGADGVGLLRSEFLYLERDSAPSAHEQAQIYTRMAQLLGPSSSLVVRTLDVGGDKPLPYLPQPREDNPFLGVRGIRLCLAQPELLQVQLRAILQAAAAPGSARLHVMFPMVASLDELRAARRILEQERARMATQAALSVGIMIEVPAAALQAEALADEVDFFSIGTNDLAQYVLAMDRGHARLAAQIDALHPAVLKMIDMTVRAAHGKGKWVGLCGNLAAEPLALPLLVGLGLDELSVSAVALPLLKQQLRALHAGDCRALAARVLQAPDTEAVRGMLRAQAA